MHSDAIGGGTMVCERHYCGLSCDLFAQGRDSTKVAIRSCYNRNTKATCLHSDAIGGGTMICKSYDYDRSRDLFALRCHEGNWYDDW